MLDGRELEARAGGHASLLDRAEAEHERVILLAGVADRHDDPWVQFCIRQADRLMLVTGEAEVPEPHGNSYAQLRGRDLLFCRPGSQSVDMTPWLDVLQPGATHIVELGPGFPSSLERVARRLAGRSVGVVLSGGGARAFAHLGVLGELVGCGAIDRVGGCSMGAFIGAMFAMECGPDEMRARCREEFVRRNPINDYTLPAVSLVRGRKARAMLRRTFGSRSIEQLLRDYFCVSCDLVSGDLIVHRDGPLYEAVGASMCVPGVFAPVAREGHLLVDGGVLNNLPVEPMARMGEGPVIAVDVTAGFLPPEASAGRRRWRIRRWAARSRGAAIAAETPLPSVKETLARVIGIGGVDALEVARRQADLLIAPETGAVGLLEFQRLDEMVEAGRRAAHEALESAPNLPFG